MFIVFYVTKHFSRNDNMYIYVTKMADNYNQCFMVSIMIFQTASNRWMSIHKYEACIKVNLLSSYDMLNKVYKSSMDYHHHCTSKVTKAIWIIDTTFEPWLQGWVTYLQLLITN